MILGNPTPEPDRARYIRRSPAIPPELDRPPLFAGVDAMIPDAPGPAEKAEATMIKIDLLAMELRDKLPHWLTQYRRNARIIALLLARAIAHAKPPDQSRAD